MNLVKKFILAMVALFVFGGCGGNISAVKNGFLGDYKSLTVGEAFDNYKYFKSTKWTEFTTDNGIKVVQVDCVVDMDKIKAENPDFDRYKEKSYVVQFTINQDNSFEITYGKSKEIKSDGSIFEIAMNLEFFIGNLYNNRLCW